MKRIIIILLVVSIFILGLIACNKWKDPAPTDSRLTNPYCNDQDAVNYNWGFPGKPDNTLCFYPTDLFRGDWSFVDSVYLASNGYLVRRDSIILHFYPMPQSHTRLAVIGFCGGDTLKLTAASASYNATVDTVVGDSITARGQLWCRIKDTVNGAIFDSRIDSMLHITFTIVSDTGITTHVGKARKL